ncbi:MAG: carbon-nitrogen hydrolase family protein [Lachnospiraceae bacterium]|nr:carbon-nitrogen hydrolase family protein [Lachnospiraceae bacterium]
MIMKQLMNICCVNFWAVHGEKEVNKKRILEFIEVAWKRGADLVLFPEMALTGYEYREDGKHMQMELAETVYGSSVSEISELTRKLGIYAIFGMPEIDGTGNYYQTMAVCGPNGFIGAARKLFLEGKEVLWAKNGNSVFEFETEWGKVVVGANSKMENVDLIVSGMSGDARLYLLPSATPAKEQLLHEKLEIVKAMIQKGKVFVAFANLAGKEMIDIHRGGSANVLGDLFAKKYGGGSFVAGPSMHSEYEVFGGSPKENEVGMIMASVDLSHAKIPYDPELIAEMRCSYV